MTTWQEEMEENVYKDYKHGYPVKCILADYCLTYAAFCKILRKIGGAQFQCPPNPKVRK